MLDRELPLTALGNWRATIGMVPEFSGKPRGMNLHHVLLRLISFSDWFDKRFGWFFTNGMKSHRLQP